jgi:SAM-dependent methyltransferase
MGLINFGDLRRLEPVSREFGFERGLPIDRHYIEKFLAQHAADIRGRVLEIGDDSYTRRFGDARVHTRDVLHVDAENAAATIVGDLADARHIPSNAFDCLILTQTLHLIYDLRKALQTTFRILKPTGVLLATFPGISQISNDQWADNWCWSLTTKSATRLFGEVFPQDQVMVRAYGNALAAISFLQGLAVAELTTDELEAHDFNCELVLSVRAVKPEGDSAVTAGKLC